MDDRPSCTVTDCNSPGRSKSASLCPKHYHRRYRHGSVDKTAWGSTIGKANNTTYRRVYRPSHPLADKYGRFWEHRAVLYDTYGPGILACHYCNMALDWSAYRFSPNAIQADHLNDVRDDNRPENLVPSCRRCNVAKGQTRRHDRFREAGWWSEHDTVAASRLGLQ